MSKADDIVREIRLQFYVNDLAIYSAFMGGPIELYPTKYCSPLRDGGDVDRVPSLVFKLANNGRVYWHDYGKTVQEHPTPPDAISFVQSLEAHSGNDLSRKGTVRLIWDTLVNNQDMPTRVIMENFTPKPSLYCAHRAKMQPFELAYWKIFDIDERYTRFFNTYGLDELVAANGNVVAESTRRDPAFVYRFDTWPDAFQTYRPLTINKANKFRGQKNTYALHGYDQLPWNADHLFIQSSRKDVMVVRRHGVLSLAPIGENTLISLYDRIRELSGRFKTIRILYDSDRAGRNAAMALSQLSGWEPVFLPREKESDPKDPADTVKRDKNYFGLSKFFGNFTLSKYHI